jgi:hypothetical protein
MQAQSAADSLNFLVNMFTGVELYEFLIGVYSDVYSYLLGQATSIAKLAENQLAFERQEAPQLIIQGDYWTAPTDQAVDPTAPAPDRLGLTGSARLLADLTRLDQHAFLTNQRKLQLSKTLSLATVHSIEFAQFRESGVLPFQTTLEMFDREYPGHYLLLIRRVKVTVLALVPPTQGIRATLSASGVSSAVVGGDLFQTVKIRRTPETTAFTGTQNATGLSDLDPVTPPDMLLPFEGMGVATSWEFRMPRAANLLDFASIADVLITIEYSALDSFEYRQQVLQDLDTRIFLDRPFSFRTGLADPWYDLHNPDQTSTPMTVRFTTTKTDFPSNLNRLRIEHVTLAYTPGDGADVSYPLTQLRLQPAQEDGTVGGAATPVNGVISTRAGNGGPWTSMQGKNPVGQWELALPNLQTVKDAFATEAIADIVLVITYSALTPDWPA